MDQDRELISEPDGKKNQNQEKHRNQQQQENHQDKDEKNKGHLEDQVRTQDLIGHDKEVFSEPGDQIQDYLDLEQGDLDPDQDQDEEDQDQMFSCWMQQYRRSRQSDGGVSRTSRRASLPCPSTLSEMRLSICAPVTANVLIRRTSSRRLLSSNQEPITEDYAPSPTRHRRPSLIPPITETETTERRSFRRRNVMSLSDAYSMCLICHDELDQERTRELPCSHAFHKECIQEWLWTRTSCPTCGVQVTLQSAVHDCVQVPQS